MTDQVTMELTEQLIIHIGDMDIEDRIEALNNIRSMLHEVSPFNREPVDCIQWVPAETVTANDYNPNAVAPP